jgi:hypothetical protein
MLVGCSLPISVRVTLANSRFVGDSSITGLWKSTPSTDRNVHVMRDGLSVNAGRLLAGNAPFVTSAMKVAALGSCRQSAGIPAVL